MKFAGEVGFWINDVETAPGVFQPAVVERHYTGDVTRHFRKWNSSEHMNDDFRLNNQIEIVADLYMQQNWTSIKYVVWNGVKWKVPTVEVDYPRLVLEIGGVYNGENAPGSAEYS